MHLRIENLIDKYRWTSTSFIVIMCFLAFNIFATPLLNSGDDTYLMYTLSGGYGEKPTNLLHYNHIWHPWLGWIVKSLFIQFPGNNWYTIILLLFHFAGCSCLLYVFLKRTNSAQALLFFTTLFLFVETRQLLSLTFTGAAFVAGAGALCLLLHQFTQKRIFNRNFYFAVALLLFAGMLRLQIAWLVIILFSSVAITLLSWSLLLRWAGTLALVVSMLWGMNKLQEQYYSNNIIGWKQQEKFRQALFYSYNRQVNVSKTTTVFSDSIEQQLFFAGFLYDSVKFNTEKVAAISKQITRNRSISNKEDTAGLYWFFIEMRIYLLLLGFFIALLLWQRKYHIIRNWLLSLTAFLTIHVYLFLFLKITMPIHLGLLLFLFVGLFVQIKNEQTIFPANKRAALLFSFLLLLSFGWMGIKVTGENNINKERQQQFLCGVKELNQQPNKLFVATDDVFPLNYFYIWNTPNQYPAANLLYKDRLITHTYLQTLKRFGIRDLHDALLNNKNVFLLGAALPALEKCQEPAVLSKRFLVYKCLEVRQLSRTD
jgi:hypothetical protein